MKTLMATHPDDFAALDSDAVRSRFLADGLFAGGELRWALTGDDRLLIGGADPAGGTLDVVAPPALHTDSLLEGRELAVVCLAGELTVTADGSAHRLGTLDVLYVGRGADAVRITGDGRAYLVSAPAHAAHPTTVARHDDVFSARLGEPAAANVRTIRRYVHADGVASANLVLGITTLEEGSVWNTMPPHTHSRRTEVYLYTGLDPDDRVVHLAGPPAATRSIVVADGEAVVSPGWSVHAGAGTRAYSFVWAMAGENQDYADMDQVTVADLR